MWGKDLAAYNTYQYCSLCGRQFLCRKSVGKHVIQVSCCVCSGIIGRERAPDIMELIRVWGLFRYGAFKQLMEDVDRIKKHLWPEKLANDENDEKSEK